MVFKNLVFFSKKTDRLCDQPTGTVPTLSRQQRNGNCSTIFLVYNIEINSITLKAQVQKKLLLQADEWSPSRGITRTISIYTIEHGSRLSWIALKPPSQIFALRNRLFVMYYFTFFAYRAKWHKPACTRSLVVLQ